MVIFGGELEDFWWKVGYWNFFQQPPVGQQPLAWQLLSVCHGWLARLASRGAGHLADVQTPQVPSRAGRPGREPSAQAPGAGLVPRR